MKNENIFGARKDERKSSGHHKGRPPRNKLTNKAAKKAAKRNLRDSKGSSWY